ncbi:nuclear factor NF-kappa-B p105 subunit [Elysia marginata]|uniref:Nuclear factor NF-kappa-B p105 subunit n=1 Tax=Elysia marginata TaxID=1093978 RepID=A0AAV4IJ36_9GAST|nr:nuclear factor NF-kappa-B p105 subunit [Elysia marginata]
MSHLAEEAPLNESNLPVELQSKNVVNPAFNLNAIPISVLNNGADHVSPRAGTYNGHGVTQDQPYVVITEQPQQRGFRFRYPCEGGSHGGLQGTRSERSRKSYPTIKVENYTGALKVVVSLVTDEKTPRPHAHKLVGTNCKNGYCSVEIKANSEPITFPNICISHVTRKNLIDVLTERFLDTLKLNRRLAAAKLNLESSISDECTAEDRKVARKQAEDQSKNMQLSVVCLCFQVFLGSPDGSFSKMLPAVVSQPIYDSKSPGASALKICRMDKYGGCCSGNEEVFLLCEKVQKDDIQVRFVEQNDDGGVAWEAYGNFGPLDVHRQYAIVFKTPAYYNTNIDKAVNVLIMLQRKSDKEVSEPKAFTYFPQNRDKDNIASKKRKRIPLDAYDFGGGDGGGGGGFGGSGLGGDGGYGADGDGGLDPSGLGRMGGGFGAGGVVGIGGNGVNNFMMAMHGNGLHRGTGVIPTPVQEAARSPMYPGVGSQLESDRLRAEVNSARSTPSMFSTENDPWICSDIEVDAAPIVDSDVQQLKFPGDVVFPDVGDNHMGANSKHKSKLPVHESQSSLVGRPLDNSKYGLETWNDSALGKSIQFLDPKNTKEYEKRSLHGISDDKEETSTNKSSSISDYHSEPDIKEYSVSIGFKSDEGFSETSEDVVVKEKAKSLPKPEKTSTPASTIKGVTVAQPSQLTDVVRKVTGRVAERTIAGLVDYAETGDIRHLLLVQRQLMTISNKNGDIPLHLSVINSQPDALKSLVDVMCTLQDSKLHINSLNHMRQTPLHLAAIMDQPTIVETLLHAGADPSLADRHGNTAAHLAVANGANQCLTSLVKYLRPGLSKANPFPELSYLNYDGYSPVHLVAQCGNVDMLRTLIYAQADVNLPDGKSGKTALHHAVDNNDLPVAGFLLTEAKTSVNARCFDGNTALHIACARQLVAMVALLITAGADQDCENEEIPDQGEEELETEAEPRGLDKLGLRPVDYANDNEKVEILCCEI